MMCSPLSSMVHCTIGSDLARRLRPSTNLGRSDATLGSTATRTCTSAQTCHQKHNTTLSNAILRTLFDVALHRYATYTNCLDIAYNCLWSNSSYMVGVCKAGAICNRRNNRHKLWHCFNGPRKSMLTDTLLGSARLSSGPVQVQSLVSAAGYCQSVPFALYPDRALCTEQTHAGHDSGGTLSMYVHLEHLRG